MKIYSILEYLDSEQIEYEFSGNINDEVESFSSLGHYKPGSFTWVKSTKNIIEGFDFSLVKLAFVTSGIKVEAQNVITTNSSKRAFFSTIEHFFNEDDSKPSIGQFTYIGPNVKLGNNVRIGHNCTLDGDIVIGDGTIIWNNVSIMNKVSIGKNCDIHSGCAIGHDGYGYTEDEKHVKTMVKHYGGVHIGDNVLIGENCCISRGTIDDTYIGNGVKIAFLVHIGHNVVIDNNSAVLTDAIVNGSVHLCENTYIAPFVSIKNQCTVGENALVGMGSVVIRDIEPNITVVGIPAKQLAKKEK